MSLLLDRDDDALLDDIISHKESSVTGMSLDRKRGTAALLEGIIRRSHVGAELPCELCDQERKGRRVFHIGQQTMDRIVSLKEGLL